VVYNINLGRSVEPEVLLKATHAVKIVMSRKWCKIVTLSLRYFRRPWVTFTAIHLLQAKFHYASWFWLRTGSEPVRTQLRTSVMEFGFTSLFKYDFFIQLFSRWEHFNWHGMSRGPSAAACTAREHRKVCLSQLSFLSV